MVPPQESPTFQAVSSATPNSSVLGLPLSMTSSASVTTAPSTQPPDTEPRKLPSWSMTRLEPTEPPAGAVQAVDLEFEPLAAVALEPVGDQQHHRALRQHAPRPLLVEGTQRGRDAGAARPVGDACRHRNERLVRVLALERAGDVGEPRAEEESMHALARVRHRMQEMQKQPRVLAHRARNVEQRHDWRRL